MADQQTVLASGYAKADEPGIYMLNFDADSGALAPKASFTGVANPSFILQHPNGRWLYAVSEMVEAQDGVAGGVWAFNIDTAAQTLTPINNLPSGGDAPCHLSFDQSGRWLFVSNYMSGTASVFPVELDGSLGPMSGWQQHLGSGPVAGRQDSAHVHSATISPDNRFVIYADLGLDQLFVYAFDAENGKIIPHKQIHTKPGVGPRHLAFHPSGKIVYVANELANSVTVYDYEAENGDLKERQALDTLEHNTPESTVADIHVAPQRNRLYVSNRGANSITVFDADNAGKLTLAGSFSCGGNWPRNFKLTSDERFMLVANQYSGDVAVMVLASDAQDVGDAIATVKVGQASCVQFAVGG